MAREPTQPDNEFRNRQPGKIWRPAKLTAAHQVTPVIADAVSPQAIISKRWPLSAMRTCFVRSLAHKENNTFSARARAVFIFHGKKYMERREFRDKPSQRCCHVFVSTHSTMMHTISTVALAKLLFSIDIVQLWSRSVRRRDNSSALLAPIVYLAHDHSLIITVSSIKPSERVRANDQPYSVLRPIPSVRQYLLYEWAGFLVGGEGQWGKDRGLNYTRSIVTSAKIITRLATACSSSRYRALRRREEGVDAS